VYLGLLGLEWFDIVVPHFVLHILIVNFSWIVSASGCRHILPNHLNLGVFVAVLFLYSALFYFIVDLGIPHLSQQGLGLGLQLQCTHLTPSFVLKMLSFYYKNALKYVE
jgi:hypothetical protein